MWMYWGEMGSMVEVIEVSGITNSLKGDTVELAAHRGEGIIKGQSR
jgi:hypothetical protein